MSVDERELTCKHCGQVIQIMRYKPDRWTKEEKEDDWRSLCAHRLSTHGPICSGVMDAWFKL